MNRNKRDRIIKNVTGTLCILVLLLVGIIGWQAFKLALALGFVIGKYLLIGSLVCFVVYIIVSIINNNRARRG